MIFEISFNLLRERWFKWIVLEINKENRIDNREIRVYEGFFFLIYYLVKLEDLKENIKFRWGEYNIE